MSIAKIIIIILMADKYKPIFDSFVDPETNKVSIASLEEMVAKAGFPASSSNCNQIKEEFKYKKQLLLEDVTMILARFERKHDNAAELKATI